MMKRGLILGCALLGLLIEWKIKAEEPIVRPPPPGIVGQDDRVPIDSAAWPWQAIGRLSISRETGVYCTGVLIATNKVLTAAHCLFNRTRGTWLDAHEVIFAAGLRRDQFIGYSRGRSIHHSHGFDKAKSPTTETIAEDWAILDLEQSLPVRPIEVHPLPSFNQAAAIPKIRLQRAGYSKDRPYLLSLHDGCAIRERLFEDRVLLTDCDSTFGDSGSPLLLKQKNTTWVVGISSAIVERGMKPGSYAVHASAFIDRLKIR
jgi:protease YdgD